MQILLFEFPLRKVQRQILEKLYTFAGLDHCYGPEGKQKGQRDSARRRASDKGTVLTPPLLDHDAFPDNRMEILCGCYLYESFDRKVNEWLLNLYDYLGRRIYSFKRKN